MGDPMTKTNGYEFREANWQNAEVWRWIDGAGTMIGMAFTTGDSGYFRLDNEQMRGPFTTRDAMLEAVAIADAKI